jgi:ubiquinone/menaquinone biosynthesis C-methylase UbiE
MRKSSINQVLLLLVLLVLGCKPEQIALPEVGNGSVVQKENTDILEKVDDSGRIVWQKPEEVVKILGDISSKSIADIGAGSGYFTFRFALKAEKVIAVDIDPSMIKIIETFKQQLPEDIQSKIEARLAKPDDPMIKNQEVDIITIINTIGYIKDRVQYLKKIKDGLKEGGEIFILDFKAKKLSINAPEMKYRVALATLENDLEKAGYEVFSSDDTTLAYQYIIRARI